MFFPLSDLLSRWMQTREKVAARSLHPARAHGFPATTHRTDDDAPCVILDQDQTEMLIITQSAVCDVF